VAIVPGIELFGDVCEFTGHIFGFLLEVADIAHTQDVKEFIQQTHGAIMLPAGTLEGIVIPAIPYPHHHQPGGAFSPPPHITLPS